MSREQSSPNRRVLRVEREIHELVSSYIIMNLSSELEGLVSVTRVIVSGDLRTAKALVYNQEGEKISKKNAELLQGYAPEIQHYINSQIRMKYCPKIHFLVDTNFESALRVQKELHKLEMERIEKETGSKNPSEHPVGNNEE